MKKRALVLISLCLVMGVSGCGKKKEELDYEQMYVNAEGERQKAAAKVEELKLALASFDTKYESEVDLSRYTVLNTGERSFTKFNDKVYFDGEVKFDSTDAISNDSTLNLVSNISISPSDTWLIQTKTSNTELYNVNGIYGQMKVNRIYNAVSADFIYDNYIKEFMESNKFPNLNQQMLFVGSSKCGVEVTSKVHLKDTTLGSDKRMIKNNAIYSSDELAAMQSDADKAVQESESQRIAEYLETLETSEPETNESGETIETTISLPETSNAAPNLETGEVEVLLPSLTYTDTDYIFKLGVIQNGDNALVYEFVYKDDSTATANGEILKALISSMKIDTMAIRME